MCRRAVYRTAMRSWSLSWPEPGIAALCDEYLTHLHSMADRPAFRAALERHLAEYGKTRDAVSRWPAACSRWRPGTPR